MHDAIYARRSHKASEGNTSIPMQLEQCRSVASPGAVEYIDSGVTGTTMDRPEFQRLLADAEAGKVSRVVVYKFDRFGRTAYAHAIVADLEAMGVPVVSATEGDDPLARGIQLVVAEDYSRKLSERIKSARARTFAAGGWLGGVAPFGYTVQDRSLSINPAEAEAVRMAYQWYADGEADYREISDRLVGRGFSPRRRPSWSRGAMRAMLLLPLYRGYRRLNGKRIETPHLRILDPALSGRVDALMESRKTGSPARRKTHAFSRLIQCGCCDHIYGRQVNICSETKKRYPAQWRCRSLWEVNAGHCPDSPRFQERELLDRIDHAAVAMLDDMDAVIDAAVNAAEASLRQAEGTAARLHKELAETDRNIDRLARILASEDLDPDAAVVLGKQLGDAKRRRDAIVIDLPADAVNRKELRTIAERESKRLRFSLGLADEDPAQLNATLHQVVGPMKAMQDGSLISLLADGSPERTLHPQAILKPMFWAYFRGVA